MPDLRTAMTLVEIVVGVAVAMLFGDFLGGRIGRARLAIGLGIVVLVAIVAFAIYAAIVLATD